MEQVSKESREGNCLKPVDFLTTAFSEMKRDEDLDLILVDQTYSYNYDIDTIAIDEVIGKLTEDLPINGTVFGLIGYDWYNPVARIQNAIIRERNGMAFYTWGDMAEIFGSIGRSLTPRIYPATVSFSTDDTSFVYDVTGPVDDRIFFGMPVVYAGKIRGETDRFAMTFTYDINESLDRKEARFPVLAEEGNIDPIEKIWAGMRVEHLLSNSSSYAYNEYNEATNLSLKYRILSSQTALIAFEPGLMDESWYQDDAAKDVGRGSDGLPVTVGAKVRIKPEMKVAYRGGMLRIKVAGIGDIGSATEFSLRIYDVKGRLVADLTRKVTVKNGEIIVNRSQFKAGSGIYVIRFVKGSTVLQKTVSVR